MTSEQRMAAIQDAMSQVMHTLQQLADTAVEGHRRLAKTSETLDRIGGVLARQNEALVRRDKELAGYRRESDQVRRLMILIAKYNGWLDENGDISSPL